MISFSAPRLDQKTVDEVGKVLLSGWITTGPCTNEFEKKLTAYLGCRKTICLSSATAAMELSLRWFGVQEGDEVIIPAYTYCSTANVVIHCGAKPVMVDINPYDFNISIEEIYKNITAKTKVIIPVDIGGMPCDFDEINELLRSEDVRSAFSTTNENQEKLGRMLVMNDAAHSLGSRYKNQMSGAICDLSVFSFHAVKNLTTAEGGAVCINLPNDFVVDEVYKSLKIMSQHGQSTDAFTKTQIADWRYDIVEPGYKYNMMDIQAAIGLIELKRYDETLARRKEIVDYYLEHLKVKSWARIPPFFENGKESSYHLFLLRVIGADENKRDQIITKIFERGVSVNVHFQPLPMLTAYKKRGFDIANYPNAFQSYSNEISLPVYYNLKDEHLETIVDAVIQSVEEILD